MSANTLTPTIFKAYDIRGIVETALTPAAVRAVGAALGSEAVEGGIAAICIGRDGRLSGPLLRDALEEAYGVPGTLSDPKTKEETRYGLTGATGAAGAAVSPGGFVFPTYPGTYPGLTPPPPTPPSPSA